MRTHGHDISDQRSRALIAEDLFSFDHILVMDSQNLNDVNRLGAGTASVERFVLGHDVPDPYYGGAGGFERVLDMIEEASRGLLADIRRRHL